MENDQEYIDMSHVADFTSHEKEDPRKALKAQFSMWVAQKISDLEARIAKMESKGEEA